MNPTSPMDATAKMLSKVLDLRAERQRVISSNVANSETPGYSAVRFEFEEELKNAINSGSTFNMKTSHPDHIPIGSGSIESVSGSITRKVDNTGIGDENSVSVDNEMLELSKNQLMYETAAQLLKKKMSLLKYAVADGQ